MLKGTMLRRGIGGEPYVPRAGTLPKLLLGKIARFAGPVPRVECSVAMVTALARCAAPEIGEGLVFGSVESHELQETIPEAPEPARPAELPEPVRAHGILAGEAAEVAPAEIVEPVETTVEAAAEPAKPPAVEQIREKKVPVEPVEVVLTVLPPQKKRAYHSRHVETKPPAPRAPRTLKVIRRRAEEAPKVIETATEGETGSVEEE